MDLFRLGAIQRGRGYTYLVRPARGRRFLVLPFDFKILFTILRDATAFMYLLAGNAEIPRSAETFRAYDHYLDPCLFVCFC